MQKYKSEIKIYDCAVCGNQYRSKRSTLISFTVTKARVYWAEIFALIPDKYELLALFLENRFLVCYSCSSSKSRAYHPLSHSLSYLVESIKPRDMSWRRLKFNCDEDSSLIAQSPAQAGLFYRLQFGA